MDLQNLRKDFKVLNKSTGNAQFYRFTSPKSKEYPYMIEMILSILVDTFISKISFPMQPGPEIGSISDA